MPKDSTTKQTDQDTGVCEPVTTPEDYILSVLLTATDAGVLAPFAATAALPAYQLGPRWDVRPANFVEDDEFFDLAVVVCADRAQLEASAMVAAQLAARRNLTVLLVPAALGAEVTVDGATVLAVPRDLVDGLAILGTLVFGATQHDGDVCCDLADITAVLDGGSRGVMFSCEAPMPKEAIAGLQWMMRHMPPDSGHGGVVTLHGGRIRDWYNLMNMVKEHVRSDTMVVGSPPGRDRSVIAGAMVMTAPAAIYIRR